MLVLVSHSAWKGRVDKKNEGCGDANKKFCLKRRKESRLFRRFGKIGSAE